MWPSGPGSPRSTPKRLPGGRVTGSSTCERDNHRSPARELHLHALVVVRRRHQSLRGPSDPLEAGEAGDMTAPDDRRGPAHKSQPPREQHAHPPEACSHTLERRFRGQLEQEMVPAGRRCRGSRRRSASSAPVRRDRCRRSGQRHRAAHCTACIHRDAKLSQRCRSSPPAARRSARATACRSRGLARQD